MSGAIDAMNGSNDFWRENNWFAIQTKPFRERLAARGTAAKDIDVFLPEVRQDQMVCGAWRVVTKSLFPGYFFAKFSPALSLDAIRHVRGVSRVLGTGKFPIPISREVILEIQDRVQADGYIRLKAPTFQRGDRVSIEEGPLAGWVGRVEREWDDHKRVAILLEAIQQARLLIEKRSLSLLSQYA